MILNLSLFLISFSIIFGVACYWLNYNRSLYLVSRTGQTVKIVDQIGESCFDEHGYHYWSHELEKV